jgi:hypothetical protein
MKQFFAIGNLLQNLSLEVTPFKKVSLLLESIAKIWDEMI